MVNARERTRRSRLQPKTRDRRGVARAQTFDGLSRENEKRFLTLALASVPLYHRKAFAEKKQNRTEHMNRTDPVAGREGDQDQPFSRPGYDNTTHPGSEASFLREVLRGPEQERDRDTLVNPTRIIHTHTCLRAVHLERRGEADVMLLRTNPHGASARAQPIPEI